MNVDAEIKRLAKPDTEPSLFGHLRATDPWLLVVAPVLFAAWIVVILIGTWWLSFLIGLPFGWACAGLGRGVAGWRQRVKEIREDRDWVDHMVTGRAEFPPDLAWTMVHLINENRTNVAARIALDYLKRTEEAHREILHDRPDQE